MLYLSPLTMPPHFWPLWCDIELHQVIKDASASHEIMRCSSTSSGQSRISSAGLTTIIININVIIVINSLIRCIALQSCNLAGEQ